MDKLDRARLPFSAAEREENLQDAFQNRYSVLFNSINQGFGICEMLFDDFSTPSDYRFLEVNSLFAAMAGLEPEQLEGNTAYTLFPHLESLWAETYGTVVLTGNPVKFEYYFAHVNRWYEINAFVIDDPQQHRFGILYNEKRDSLRDAYRRRYNALFDSIDQGFCICEMIFDAQGQPLDYLFLEINNKYESMTGLTQVIGRTAKEIIPGLEEFWFETYGRVVQTGKSERFENYVSPMCQWFDVNAFPIESANNNRFGILFTDISDRKRREQSSNFLAEIQSDLERLATPNEIKRVVGAKIYNWFGFSLLTFNDIDATGTKGTVIYNNRDLDIPDAVTTHHLPDYFSEVHLNRLRAGEIVAIDDVTTDMDIKASDADRHDEYQIRSMVTVPYLSDGQWKFAIGGCRREASNWRQDQIELIDELTARIYLRIDRARTELALSESEARFRNVADTAPVLIWMSGTDKLCYYFNKYWLDFSGRSLEQEMGNGWTEGVYADDFQLCLDTYCTAFDAREPFQMEYRLRRFDGQYRWLVDIAQPRFTPDGKFLGYIGSCIDIEDRKRQELNNKFLGEIQTDLAMLVDTDQIMQVVGEKIRQRFDLAILTLSDISATDESTTFYNNHDGNLLNVEAAPKHYLPNFLSETHLGKLRAGQIVAVDDVSNNPDIKDGGAIYQPYQVNSLVNVPYLSNGEWKFLLGGNRRQLSNWQEEEIKLLRELTERLCLRIDRAHAESALQEVNQRLRIALVAGDVGVWDLDLVTLKAWRSPQHDLIFGYDSLLPEWSYEMFLEHVIPKEREQVDRGFKAAIATHTDWDIECCIHRVDGESRWIWTKANTEYNDSGEAVRMYGVVKDISDRKFTELALQQSEERYRHLVELIPQIVWTADREGKAIDINQRWLDFTGSSDRIEIHDLGLRPYFHPEDVDIIHDRWTLAIQEGVQLQAEARLRRHDGVYRWYLHQAVPIKNDRGEIIKWFGTGTDIDEQKQLEHQYSNLLEKVQERNQELDQFSHIVSHDLKAPLRAIANLSQWLEDDIADLIPEDNQQQLQLMRSRVYRMEALITGLLNYARVAREDIPSEAVSIEELLAETVDSLDPPSTFAIEIVRPLPTFTTKRILLNQVLANLIGNAIKHHDRPDGKVKISVEAETEFYRFNITDDGKGIAPSQQSRVFDIFQTVEGLDKKQGQNQSTGIGLAIVKKIVETEGGEIQLTSEIGKGSTFSFTWRK